MQISSSKPTDYSALLPSKSKLLSFRGKFSQVGKVTKIQQNKLIGLNKMGPAQLLRVNSRQMSQLETVGSSQKSSDDLVVNSLRGENRRPYSLELGQSVNGFTVKAIDDIPDFKIKAFTLEHDKTGAQYLHLDSPDMENVSHYQ